MIYKPNFFIVSGGPGVGKTTLLETISRLEYAHVPEVAREIIREQSARDGDALPWANITTYTRLMLTRSIDSYLQHQACDGILFFDRGIPDTLAYVHLTRQPVFSELQRAVLDFRYNSLVFILPPWPEIYQTDTERKQTYQEAVETHDIMLATYRQLDYSPIIVPQGTPEERAAFVIRHLSKTPIL